MVTFVLCHVCASCVSLSGSSGSGKSSLLRLLAGQECGLASSSGMLYFHGERVAHSLSAHGLCGFMPSHAPFILIEELTTQEMLSYVLGLRSCYGTDVHTRDSDTAKGKRQRHGEEGNERPVPVPVSSTKNKGLVLEILDQIGLSSSSCTVVSQLSGGQRRRLALACAIFASPNRDLFILDEPTSGNQPRHCTALRCGVRPIC